MKLDTDLQRILNVGAKVYDTASKKQGKVIDVSNDNVCVDYGNSAASDVVDYGREDFEKALVDDKIVANYRLTMGPSNNFKVIPRTGPVDPISGKSKPAKPKPKTSQSKPAGPKLEVGYVNFKSGRFSKTSKKGYTKIEYRKAVQKVELELDDEQLKKLKEMGLI